ncbi:MAG: dehydrogenase FAD-containing subunit, partial [Actinomycetota bacterium]|nr:dehydrogenase FAD-containing subunit [Actinomycetota bacterium]
TGIVALDDITFPIADLRGVEAITDTVTEIDCDARMLTLASGGHLSADYIVIATGSQVNFFGVTGAAEHALPLYTAADAARIGQRGRELLNSSAAFAVAVVGAGATGVEVTGAMADVIEDLYPRTFPGFRREQVELHVIDHASAPLAHMSAASQDYAREVLTSAGVTWHLGRSVADVTASDVGLDDGTRVPADMTIWAGGLSVRVPPMTPEPARDGHGRVVIDPDLRLAGQGRVYCIGDAAADAHEPLPQLGSVAKQQGIAVARAIRRQLRHKKPKPFSYTDLGDMAMIRHDAATVELGASHHPVNGELAFAMWLGLHAYLLPGDDHRMEALHAWVHEMMTGKSKYLLA